MIWVNVTQEPLGCGLPDIGCFLNVWVGHSVPARVGAWLNMAACRIQSISLLWRHHHLALCHIHTGDPLHSRALAHSRAPLLTQPCPHCSHSRALGEQWARLCVFTLQGCVQAARLCRGSPVIQWLCRNCQPFSQKQGAYYIIHAKGHARLTKICYWQSERLTIFSGNFGLVKCPLVWQYFCTCRSFGLTML